MDQAHWQLVEQIFLAAVERRGRERAAYLDTACGDDDALRRDVERLLHHDDPRSNFMRQMVGEGARLAVQAGAMEAGAPDHGLATNLGTMASGRTLAGRYRVGPSLGRGGMGAVYLAEDLTLGQPVALKLLPELTQGDPAWRERLLSEVRIARQITHPNVVRVFDVVVDEGCLMISMEYVDGEDLACLLSRVGRLNVDKAIELSGQLCDGLAAAHDLDVIHRDLKPANLLLDRQGRARIVDFGLAAFSSQLRDDDMQSGTPAYMAPEQQRGEAVSVQSDLYALGLVLYQLFTGRRAFDQTNPDQTQSDQAGSDHDSRATTEGESNRGLGRPDLGRPDLGPPDLGQPVLGQPVLVPPSQLVPELPPRVERTILQLLAQDPRDRPRSVREVGEAIRGVGVETGWRPTASAAVPGRERWIFEARLAETESGELWLTRHRRSGAARRLELCYTADCLPRLRQRLERAQQLERQLGQRSDIARALDWSLDREPYFVETEHPTAGDLRSWLRPGDGTPASSRLSRLDVIAQVAEALAAAHSVGVLHQGLRPECVLLTASDATPAGVSVQLTGFGLCGPALTRAPEQRSGEAATIQGDVYSLGLLLFQTLVGDFERVLAPGWQREIGDPLLCEDISRALDGDPRCRLASAAEVAERLRTLPQRVAKARAEHEAAEASARHRQESAEAALILGAAQRWRRRLTLAAVLLTLLAGALGWQVWKAQASSRLAEKETRAAQAATDFLVSTFELANPARSGGEELTATELLLYGADRAEADLVDQPSVQAAVLAAIGDALVRQNLHDRAAPLIETALATSRRLDDAPAVHRLMTIQCQIARRNRDFEGAKALATELVDLVQSAEVVDDATQANAFFELGRAQYRLFENEAAEQSFRRSLAFQRVRNPPRPDSLARALGSLAGVLRRQGKLEAAEEAGREELTVVQQIHSEDDPLVASALHRLSLILVDLDRWEEAQALLEETIAMKRRLYGDDSLDLATSVNNLGHLALLRGELELAESNLQKALEMRRRSDGEESLGQVSMLANLGRVAQLKGQYEVGEALLRRAIEIRSSHLGPSSVGSLQYQTYLAGLLVAKEQVAAASGLAQEILRELASTEDADPRPWFAALAEAVQVACEVERARFEGAEARLSAALADLRQSRGPRSLEARQVEGYLERLGQRERSTAQVSGR